MMKKRYSRWIGCFFVFLIVGGASADSSLIASVENLRAALKSENYAEAKTFLTEDPRVWYDGHEGKGSPWKLSGGRWKGWDQHFNGVSTPQGELQADGRKVWADFLETNDYFRLIGRGGGFFRQTWFFDAEGKIEGTMISSVPGTLRPAEGRSDEFEMWAQEHAPEELAYLKPGGKIDPTGDRPQRFRTLLERWRQAIGEPVDLSGETP